MIDRKDLRIPRLIEPQGGIVRTDPHVPFVFLTDLGEAFYDISASNQGEPLSYQDGDVAFELPDAPTNILYLEFGTRDVPYLSRVELGRVPPLLPPGLAPRTAAEALIVPFLPVVKLGAFTPPHRRDGQLNVSVIREVFLELLPLYYRISWERESPTTIFDCGPVRWGSVGATIVCLDIEIASLDMTDEFDQRIAEGPLREWPAATISDLYLTYLDRG
ncbi:hypothetical protein B7R22_18525 [Subtercola boreus]|uniref:Uncharacterized protein n=1 Tax=Subtercola boreus TaxID=120213 RepID=A0A3E0VNS0_9MICO|nr:hypothetical protein [Subtercola boreus]RFA11654.1 hypothetical protein B7R22_18525 [Subtercola boreus]